MKILVLAPHTDDGELGCGATLAKYIRRGEDVYYAAFSSCEDSLPEGAPKDTLIKELQQAMACLQVPKDNIHIFHFPVRRFGEHRQDILDTMIRLNRDIRPDTVFMPSVHDIHQDHSTIAAEGLRAFKKTTIFAYEVPWNNFTFNNQAFSVVEEEDVQKKVEAIRCYRSQEGRDYANEEFTRALLKTHGVQIGVPYAEVFEIPRSIF